MRWQWQDSCLVVLAVGFMVVSPIALAASAKTHAVTLGKWTTVQWLGAGPEEERALTLKVRPLLVDGRIKEFTSGLAHEVTDRLFAIRRAFRLNDSLPQETAGPRWQWQRGGWLLVDRATGRIAPLALPDFDAVYSDVSWYRDYAAYCGVSDEGKKIYAVVAQLNRRKPVLRKLLEAGEVVEAETKAAGTDFACPTPAWQRSPVRVSFEDGPAKKTFAIRGHVVDVMSEEVDEEEAAK